RRWDCLPRSESYDSHSCGLRARQFDPEAASPTLLRLDADASAEPLDPLLDDRQTNTRSRIRFRAVQALEDAEDPLLMRGCDPDALVLDPHLSRPRLSRFRPDADAGVTAAEFDGVRQEIREDLNQHRSIALHSRELRRDVDMSSAALHVVSHRIQGCVKN